MMHHVYNILIGDMVMILIYKYINACLNDILLFYILCIIYYANIHALKHVPHASL